MKEKAVGALARNSGFLALAILFVAAVSSARSKTDPTMQRLVADGEKLWAGSPDPTNPVACATCHFDVSRTRAWAASFPKFKPMPPPNSRVMTLLQANAEAVNRHYRIRNPLPAATAITAYLMVLGAKEAISPGAIPGQPLFEERMRQLRSSADRGKRLYTQRCGACHEEETLAPSIRAFPRLADGVPRPLEKLMENHPRSDGTVKWDGQPVADLIAYLVSRLDAHHDSQRSDGTELEDR